MWWHAQAPQTTAESDQSPRTRNARAAERGGRARPGHSPARRTQQLRRWRLWQRSAAVLLLSCALAPHGVRSHQCRHGKVEGRFHESYNGQGGVYTASRVEYGEERRRLQRSAQSSAVYEPLRIHVVTDPVEEFLRDEPAILKYLKLDVIPAALNWVQLALRVKRAEGPLSLQPQCGRLWMVQGDSPPSNPSDIKCVALSPNGTMCGDVPIPEEHLSPISMCPDSVYSCTRRYEGGGVPDADYILYVTANFDEACQSESVGSTVGYAGHCRRDQHDRPIAGQLNLCPRELLAVNTNATNDTAASGPTISLASDQMPPTRLLRPERRVLQGGGRSVGEGGMAHLGADWRMDVSFVVHETLHALGFSESDIAWFRDVDGQPLTHRDEQGRPPFDASAGPQGGWLPSAALVDTSNATGRVVKRVTTPRVVTEAQKHFGCESMTGLALEDQGDFGTRFGHWESRLLQSEGMTGSRDGQEHAAFSSMTLAFFEDSGWYLPDYSWAGDLTWGHRSFTRDGCSFVAETCLNQAEGGGPPTPIDPNHFCVGEGGQEQKLHCTQDLRAVALCPLAQYESPLPLWARHFEDDDTRGGPSQMTNFCPIWMPFERLAPNGRPLNATSLCTDPSNDVAEYNYFGEVYGEDSRCMASSLLEDGYVFDDSRPPSGRCYRRECVTAEGDDPHADYDAVIVHLQGGQQVRCGVSDGGKWKTVEGMNGQLRCPHVAQVCFGSPCENGGVWRDRRCVCPPGYIGKRCSHEDRSGNRRIIPSYFHYTPDDVTIKVGSSYRFEARVQGIVRNYTSISALPEGLTLDTDTGTIEGTPKETTDGCLVLTIAAGGVNEEARGLLRLSIVDGHEVVAMQAQTIGVRMPCGTYL